MQHTVDIVEHLDLARPRFAGGGTEVVIRPGLVGGVDPGGLADGGVELEVKIQGAMVGGERVTLLRMFIRIEVERIGLRSFSRSFPPGSFL